MNEKSNLPPEFTIRPATFSDLDETAAFLNHTDQHDLGTRTFSRETIAGDWQKPSWNMEDNTRLIFNQANEIVGYAEAYQGASPPVKTNLMARTHPGYRSAGLGTYFLLWGENLPGLPSPSAPQTAGSLSRLS